MPFLGISCLIEGDTAISWFVPQTCSSLCSQFVKPVDKYVVSACGAAHPARRDSHESLGRSLDHADSISRRGLISGLARAPAALRCCRRHCPGATPSSASGSLGSAWLATGRRLVPPERCGLDQIGGDRLFVARAGENGREQHEEEHEGKAGQADANPLHAASRSPAPRSTRRRNATASRLSNPAERCREPLAENGLDERMPRSRSDAP